MKKISLISFDCYGTLIDWRKGVLNALHPFLEDYFIEMDDEQIFSLFREFDENLVTGKFQSYDIILTEIMKLFGKSLNINIQEEDFSLLADSLPQWPLFADTNQSLENLRQKYKLAIISNIDRPLLEKTLKKFNIRFDYYITSGELGSYKPSSENFLEALQQFKLPSDQLLHVAQSRFHDILPARELGLQAVWINRYHDPVPPVEDDQYPGMHFPDLKSFVDTLT